MPALSEKTRFSLTLASAAVFGIGLLKLGWTGANLLRDIRDEIGSLRTEVRSINEDRWTAQDMERWSAKLEKNNRTLNVPDPGQILAERR